MHSRHSDLLMEVCIGVVIMPLIMSGVVAVGFEKGAAHAVLLHLQLQNHPEHLHRMHPASER
jgi:hypothetical protein